MNGSLKEMVALQDIHVAENDGIHFKEITPTRFYALSSGVLVAFGTYWIATLFSTVAASAFDLRTADLIIQINFAAFLFISIGLLMAPFLKLQRYMVKVKGEETRLFHYQEATVVVVGILFMNIPLLFLTKAVAMYESLAQIEILSEQAREYLDAAAPFANLHTSTDVAICALFGAALLVIKFWVFKRVAKRFVQGKRFRAARA